VKKLPCLLLAPFALPAAFAAEPTPPVRLEPVVVTATRDARTLTDVPASLDVLDATTLRRARPALGLAEALPRVPGVVVRDRQNQAQDLQISIRGFGARASFGVRGVRLYADGIPATMPDGQGQVSHFALGAAERVEVLRGPFSALYGNSAGSVIAVFSEAPPSAHEMEGDGLAGSDGLWRAGASWRGPLTDHAGLRVDAARATADGYRRHSAWRRDAAQAQLRARFSGGGELTLLLNHLDLAADDPQGLTAAELARDRRVSSPGALLFDTRKTVEQQQLGARFVQAVGDWQELALVAYAGRRQTFQGLSVPVAAQASPTSGGGVIDLDRDYRGLDARWQARPGDGALTFTAGTAFELADETRLGFENFAGGQLGVVGALRRDEDNRVRSQDVYAQAGWDFAPDWQLNAGLRRSVVRFESVDRYLRPGNPDDSGALRYARTTPVLGLLWRAAEGLSVYANAGTGFETPTFAELAYRSDGASGLNTALRPARSRHAELGLRWRGARARLDAALFHARTEDELVVVANQGGRSTFANAGLTRRQGAELSFEVPLAEAWTLSASATWLDARHHRDVGLCAAPPCTGNALLIVAGRQLPGIAARSAWAELRWRADEQTDVMLEARATSRFFADDGNTAWAPGHAVFDLAAERRFRAGGMEWRAWARVANVLDRAVVGSVIVNEANRRYFEPAPGRQYLLGLTATFR
jgi:iron complex outermembrane receptor protein